MALQRRVASIVGWVENPPFLNGNNNANKEIRFLAKIGFLSLDDQVFDVIWLLDDRFLGHKIGNLLIFKLIYFLALKIIFILKSITYKKLDHQVS